MLVNRGGDPERDDYGLPPVDIEIPDDARELDRDIQAYQRELRVQRRHRLARRLGGPLTRDGMVLPLLASCLALTLLAGTLLTMFTARRALPGTLQTTSVPRPSRPAVGQVGGLLPEASVTVGSSQSAALRDFHPSVLALVPAGLPVHRGRAPAEPAGGRGERAALFRGHRIRRGPGPGAGPPQRPQRRLRDHR